MSSPERKVKVIAVLLLVALGAGCTGFFVNPTLSSIAIGPQGQTITSTTTLQMAATGNYSDGSTKDLTGKALWSSSTPSCATINGSGLVTPVSNVTGVCSTTISASSGTVSPATTTVTVSGGTPSQITLSVSSTIPTRNTTLTFKALGSFSGKQQDITSSVTWNNSDTINLTLTNGSGTGTISANAVSGTVINVSASFAGVTSNTVTLTVQ